MSKNLSLFQSRPLIGIPYGQAIGICTKPTKEPTVVRVDINWSDYNVSNTNSQVGVAVNLIAQGSVAPALDKVRSIKIDNSYCPVPMYVQFPDTLDAVTCPPYSIVISPVATQVQEAIIYGDGFFTGRPPRTTVEFFNVQLDPLFIPGTLQDNILIEYCGPATVSGALAQLTFPTINIEAAPTPDRILSVALANYNTATAAAFTITSVTINGVAATLDIQKGNIATGATYSVVAIAHALVPLGNTLSVVVNYSSAVQKTAIMFGSSIKDWTNPNPVSAKSDGGTSLTALRSMTFPAIPGAAAFTVAADPSAGSVESYINASLIDLVISGVYEATCAKTAFDIAASEGVSVNALQCCGVMYI